MMYHSDFFDNDIQPREAEAVNVFFNDFGQADLEMTKVMLNVTYVKFELCFLSSSITLR